jgi:hypothetical protein
VPVVDPPLFALPDDDEPSFLAFLLQQVFVPLASLLTVAIVPGVPWKFAQSGVSGQLIEVARCMIVSAVAGLVLGSTVRRVLPKASGASWIGALPAILMVWVLVSDTFTFSFTAALAELFFPGPDGEDWWVFALLTCPTIATLSYSASVTWPLFARKSATCTDRSRDAA